MRKLAVREPQLTGWHRLLWLLPRRWRARVVGRAVARARPEWRFEDGPIYLLTSWGEWEILDAEGRVRPAARVPAQLRR